MNNKMRLERLRKLAEILRDFKNKVPQVDRFDMATWYETGCGTAACALGSAATHPWFKRRGLRLHTHRFFEKRRVPEFRGGSGILAGAGFFGITERESSVLFDPSKYDMKAIRRPSVIKRINELITKYESAQ